MDTAKNPPLTLAVMIETLLKDGYVMHFEPSNQVFVVAKVAEEEIHFGPSFLEAVREPYFGPRELRDANDPRIKELSSEATGLETGVKVTKNRIDKTCPHCGHTSRKYKRYFHGRDIAVCRKLFEVCVKNKTHLIDRSMLNNTLTHVEYSNFAYLQRFGLIYFIKDENGKNVRGEWGVALSRLHKFLKNEWKVAEYFWRDTDSGRNEMSDTRIFMSEVDPKLDLTNPDTQLPAFLEFETDSFFASYHKE